MIPNRCATASRMCLPARLKNYHALLDRQALPDIRIYKYVPPKIVFHFLFIKWTFLAKPKNALGQMRVF